MERETLDISWWWFGLALSCCYDHSELRYLHLDYSHCGLGRKLGGCVWRLVAILKVVCVGTVATHGYSWSCADRLVTLLLFIALFGRLNMPDMVCFPTAIARGSLECFFVGSVK